MIIKFIGFLIFLLMSLSGFWCVIFLSLFSLYWIISFLLYKINIFIKTNDKKNN